MKVSEAAQKLGVTKTTVLKMIQGGDLQAEKDEGGAYNVLESSVDAMSIYRKKKAERKSKRQQKQKESENGSKEQTGEGGDGDGKQSERTGFLRGKWWF